jgi:hypothetical protein
VIEKVKGIVTKQRAFDVKLLDSFAAASLQELDYLREAENQVPSGVNVMIVKVFPPKKNVFFTEENAFSCTKMSLGFKKIVHCFSIFWSKSSKMVLKINESHVPKIAFRKCKKHFFLGGGC